MVSDNKDMTKIVRKGDDQVCREFTTRLDSMGFSRTRKKFWTRRHPLTVDFIHLHRGGISYGQPIRAVVSYRVHFGIRLLNSSFEALALNGPDSDPFSFSERYHMQFNAKSFSMFDRCVNDLVRFVEKYGQPWFQKFESIENLLNHPDTPLKPDTQELLHTAIIGNANLDFIAASYKLLGMKKIGK